MLCLVTGSSGFIGRHFAQHLRHTGNRVHGIDIANPIHPVDCRTFFREQQVERYDLVVHCAANVGGRENIDNNPFWIAENLAMDAALFKWAAKTRPGRIVYFSSSAVYPIHLQREPYNLAEEDADPLLPAEPDAMYGYAKMTGEYMALLARQNGLKVHVFRPFSGYGEDQSLDYPFPSFAARAAAHADPFEIWGSADQVRDWIHVTDIIGAVMRAIEVEDFGPMNLGWGTPISFRDLAQHFVSLAQYETEPKILPLKDRPQGVKYRCADASRMFRIYSPKVTLREGIVRALAARLQVPEWSYG